VKGTEYFDGKTKGYVDSPVTDILQMMGRAGRPQFDNSAVACIFVHEPKKNFYRKFLHEPFPVESSLHLQLHEHINAEIANGTIHSLPDAIEYLTWTYFFRRLLINPSYYQLEDASPAGVQEYLSNLIGMVVNDLQRMGCVDVMAEDVPVPHYQSTFLGKITSYYYLHYRTAFRFSEQFSQLHAHLLSDPSSGVNLDIPIDILMKIMCDAAEFSELPVRHNEEHLNADLAISLAFSPSSSLLGSMESPHTKAFLLLHAFLRKAKLPISDYINDTKTVFDQVPRVLNAMIDIAAEQGFVPIVMALIRLSQLLTQVRNKILGIFSFDMF
jgi:replicative superfamily II helicase